MPFYLQIWPSSTASQWLLAGAALLLVALVVGFWLLVGRGPRRRRGLKAARRLLEQGDWQRALQVIQQLEGKGGLSFTWQNRLWSAEGECHRAAMTHALAQKNYESAMEHAVAGAILLKKKESEARAFVIEAMLGEVRRLFANSLGNDTSLAQELIARTLALQPSSEAHFWQGLCFLREGRNDRAMTALQAARGEEEDESAKKTAAIDPPLYLGALLLRQGPAKNSLRYLTEANRIDSNCPFVTWELGTAIIQAGGDAQLAVRALQRALGPRGFGMWVKEPVRAWVEGFPENRSYVRKLAQKHAFVCPLWGSDLQNILRQGNIALGQGLHRLGQFQEAADVFGKLLQEGAPSLPVLRGLGLALARLGQYDTAFKHLRTAHEMEDPKERSTAGYLALCGARGKPTRPEDKVRNVTWAIRLVDQFTAPGDVEWAGLVNAIFAEARALGLSIDANDQIYLCEHLLSVRATDPMAAEAYHHLAGTHPEDLRAEYAWLFCRAAQEHGVGGAYSPALFARTFAEEQRAREFFAQQKWDFDAIELTYLQRAAEVQPGSFPTALGPDYPPRGEKLLLEKSQQEEQAGNPDAALSHAQVLVQLAPASTRAHDRLAYLYHRRGDLARAAELLQAWHRLQPDDPVPLVRRAVIYQALGVFGRCLDTIRAALAQTTGPEHAKIAFLGARLLLKSSETPAANGEAPSADGQASAANAAGSPDAIRRSAQELLEDCLKHDPQHVEATWCLAAVRSLLGDDPGLARQAAQMDRPDVADARFHFLGGVCNLAAKNYPGVLEACRRTAAACEKQGTKSLAVESAYLLGWAYWLQEDLTSAARFLQTPAQTTSPSQAHARALLGRVYFAGRNYKEAARWWQALEPKQRTAWKFADTLAGTMFLSALEAYRDGKYPDAAEKLREAGRLGLRDRRLGLLLSLSLVKAGQQWMYPENDER